MTIKPYKTLLTRASDEFIINKSRFIGYGAPAASEEEALGFLADVRSAHKDVSHHCYAYIIGANMGVMRYSDDGEPGGTAGMPIIEVMKARQITNACVVVVRYFGGVLLGAGGLTRAYSQGAATAINAAGVGEVSPTRRYLMEVPYPMLGRVEYLLKSLPVIVEDKQFSDAIVMTLIVRARDDEAFLSAVTSGTDGRIEPIFMEEMYKAWTE